MYYWEAAPLTSSWTTIYSGVPPFEGVDVAIPSDVVTIKVTYDPSAAVADVVLRNFKRNVPNASGQFTFVNVARVYPLVGGSPKEGVEITCPETVISFDWINRQDSKGLRIMPKGLLSEMTVQASSRRWIQKKFDKM
ncbi:MAG: hypothetical protein ACRCSI_02410 [Eubacterium aggregans]